MFSQLTDKLQEVFKELLGGSRGPLLDVMPGGGAAISIASPAERSIHPSLGTNRVPLT